MFCHCSVYLCYSRSWHFFLSHLKLNSCTFRLSSTFKLRPKTQQRLEGYIIHHYENAINCPAGNYMPLSLFPAPNFQWQMFSGFSACSVFSPLALHIWHSVSWTAATPNASGSTTHGTEILAKYFPPFTGRAHLCSFWLLKIFNLCYFYSLACLSTDVSEASVFSCSLSTHETKIRVSCLTFLWPVPFWATLVFLQLFFTRHRSVEAYNASRWNSRTWAVNENIIGVCEFDIFRKCVLAKNACLCWFFFFFKVENPF